MSKKFVKLSGWVAAQVAIAVIAVFVVAMVTALSALGVWNPAQTRHNAAATRPARQRPISTPQARRITRIGPYDRVYGPKHASLTLIEYADYECPFCKAFSANPEKVVDNMRGRVNLIYRFFPLARHGKKAFEEANAGACVEHLSGAKSFWAFTQKVFESTASNGAGTTTPLSTIARRSGVNVKAFRQCLKKRSYNAVVAAQEKGGLALGVRGTPTTLAVMHHPLKIGFLRGNVSSKAMEAFVKRMMAYHATLVHRQ